MLCLDFGQIKFERINVDKRNNQSTFLTSKVYLELISSKYTIFNRFYLQREFSIRIKCPVSFRFAAISESDVLYSLYQCRWRDLFKDVSWTSQNQNLKMSLWVEITENCLKFDSHCTLKKKKTCIIQINETLPSFVWTL